MGELPEIEFKKGELLDLGTEIIDFDYFRDQMNLPTDHDPKKPHRLKFYSILFVTGGRNGTHHIDFEQYNYTTGNVILIAKEQVHYFIDIVENDGYMLMFTEAFLIKALSSHPNLVNHLYNNQLYHPIISFDREKFIEIVTLIEKAKSEIDYFKAPVQSEIIRSYITIILLKLFQARKENNRFKDNPYLNDFLSFQQLLKTHIHKERKVQFYADLLNITPKRLNSITKNIIDSSAKDYIIATIILEAKRYLKSSTLTSKEISYHLGFDEPTNFTKFFKKYTGCSPSQFVESF